MKFLIGKAEQADKYNLVKDLFVHFTTTMLAIAQEETPPRGDGAHVKSAPEAAAQVVGVRQPKGGGIAPKV